MTALPAWTRAWGDPIGHARVAVRPEDFQVDERLGFLPEGDGPHLLVRIRKSRLSTARAMQALAGYWQVERRQMGYAGRKDRYALTTQWLSVPWPPGEPLPSTGPIPLEREPDASLEVMSIARHRRKLPVGALAGNDFRLTLRDLEASADALQARVVRIARHGVPNYFGPQRFGRDGDNLLRARQWFAGEHRPRSRNDRSMLLSAARAAVFNAVLDTRVQAGDWHCAEPGEILMLDGRGSVFLADPADARHNRLRAAGLRVHPTGPLPGRPGRGLGLPAPLAARENRVMQDWADLVEGLSDQGLEAGRRALRLSVGALAVRRLDGRTWQLAFRLMRGAYATTVLRELIDWDNA